MDETWIWSGHRTKSTYFMNTIWAVTLFQVALLNYDWRWNKLIIHGKVRIDLKSAGSVTYSQVFTECPQCVWPLNRCREYYGGKTEVAPECMDYSGEGKETDWITNCDKFRGATERGAEVEKIGSGDDGSLYCYETSGGVMHTHALVSQHLVSGHHALDLCWDTSLNTELNQTLILFSQCSPTSGKAGQWARSCDRWQVI